MDVKVLLWQQRRQLKRLEFVTSHFSLTVESWFAFNHLMPCLPVIHKHLRSFDAHFTMVTTHGEGLCRVRLQELGPVFAQQVAAGKYIGPNDAAFNRDHHADSALIA